MKIRDGLNSSANVAEVLSGEQKKPSDVNGNVFYNQLRKVEKHNVEERINYLINRITEQGKKLGEKVDLRELKVYKKLISEFLDETLNNSHKFSKESFIDRRGRYRVYATVKKINTELEELTKDVLSAEKDNIKILQRIEDIRGLVLDISL
ncbi:MAG: YaaR family protein [Clostridiaceae bacterium]|nr:YaaR family protein [Clostridiaceae bacterium]